MYMIGGSIIIIFMSVQIFIKVHDQFYYGKLAAGSSYIARICKSIITILISIGKKPQKPQFKSHILATQAPARCQNVAFESWLLWLFCVLH